MEKCKGMRMTRILFSMLLAVLLLFSGMLPASFSVAGVLTVYAEDEESVTYTVEKGDSLTRIARNFGVRVEDIIRDNQLEDQSLIYAGQELVINSARPGSKADRGEVSRDESGSTADTKVSDAGSGKISLELHDTDLRDALSILALHLEKGIILVDEPVKVNFRAEDVTPMYALETILHGVGMDYLSDGTIIVAGKQDKLQKDFFSRMSLARYALKYVTAESVGAQIDQLGIPVKKVTLEENSKSLWAQGTPQALYKVRELVGMIDRADVSPSMNLTSFQLEYISADVAADLIKQLGLSARVIVAGANSETIWVSGNVQVVKDIEDLLSKVDILENMGSKNDNITVHTMKNLTAERLEPIAGELDLPVKVIATDSASRTVFLMGGYGDINRMIDIINKIDEYGSSDITSNFYIRKLKYISATDAAARLNFLKIPGVTAFTMNYPQFAKDLLIGCSADKKNSVESALNSIDVRGQVIKVPVDSSWESKSRLEARKDLLVELSGIPESSFEISDNVSKTDDSYYVMWVEETPDNVKKIRDLITSIDAPGEQGDAAEKGN